MTLSSVKLTRRPLILQFYIITHLLVLEQYHSMVVEHSPYLDSSWHTCFGVPMDNRITESIAHLGNDSKKKKLQTYEIKSNMKQSDVRKMGALASCVLAYREELIHWTEKIASCNGGSSAHIPPP